MVLLANLQSVQSEISACAASCNRNVQEICLVCVSKGHTVDQIMELHGYGLRDFGENRLPEALEKMKLLPSDIRWHFVGSLQSNKVNKVVGKFFLIHSIDSLDLAEKIARAAASLHITQNVLLQVNISSEKQKHGMSPEFVLENLNQIVSLPALRFQGLMTMAPNMKEKSEEERAEILQTFEGLANLKEQIIKSRPDLEETFRILSMGMSQDFAFAIRAGATHLRIGSKIFSSE